MSAKRHRWAARCDPPTGLVRPSPIDPTGRSGPTRGQARSSGWRASSYGLYVPAAVDQDVPEQRILEQSARLKPGGAVTGWASLRVQGGNFFDGLAGDGRTRLPVPLNPGVFHQLAADDRCTVSRDRLFEPEIEVCQGIPCTAALRALFDEARYATNMRRAVVAIDMAAAAELVSLAMLRDYVAEHPAWTGVDQVRKALELASEDSWSPKETQMRLVWVVDAGLPAPVCNRPVFTTGGTYVGRPDMLDIQAGVVGEYDGADHRLVLQHSSDIDREERFRRLGLEYFKVTGPDSRGRVVDRMHSTRSRARFDPPDRRDWTIDPPAWWEPEPSLDERIALRQWRSHLHTQWAEEELPDVRTLRGW